MTNAATFTHWARPSLLPPSAAPSIALLGGEFAVPPHE
jgi:hypothetical protein